MNPLKTICVRGHFFTRLLGQRPISQFRRIALAFNSYTVLTFSCDLKPGATEEPKYMQRHSREKRHTLNWRTEQHQRKNSGISWLLLYQVTVFQLQSASNNPCKNFSSQFLLNYFLAAIYIKLQFLVAIWISRSPLIRPLIPIKCHIGGDGPISLLQ
jgi:hypothetical protein